MKPFNLEEAKAGKPVCTRNGKDVRIICFDSRIVCFDSRDMQPIIALVDFGSRELTHYHDADGSYYRDGSQSAYDLMMKSTKEKRWIVVGTDRKSGNRFALKHNDTVFSDFTSVFSTQEDALFASQCSKNQCSPQIIEIEVEIDV